MPDKRPDHNPDIGWIGRMELLAIVVLFAVAALGWLFW